MALVPHVEKRDRDGLCKNRRDLDAWLSQPVGIQAEAEAALIRELKGA